MRQKAKNSGRTRRRRSTSPAPPESRIPNPEPPFFAHESSYIDEGCRIGEGTKIWHFTHIMSGASIGRGCNIGQNVVISPDVVIGDNVKIQNNVSVYTGVVLEDDVFCGPSMVFTNVLNPRSHVPRKHEYQKTLVRRGASLGANCTIVCGRAIGQFAFIGAGAVVTKDVPDYALVVGNPARLAGWMCACGVKVAAGAKPPAEIACRACGARYRVDRGSLRPLRSAKARSSSERGWGPREH